MDPSIWLAKMPVTASPVPLSTFSIGPRPFFHTVWAGLTSTFSSVQSYLAGTSRNCQEAGFTLLDQPHIRASRAMLFQK